MREQTAEGFINDAGDANDGNGDDRLTRLIIGCAFTVANGLGVGFVEKVYENALAYKLRPAGLHIDQQRAVEVRFEGQVVDTDVADLVVNNMVVVELQAVNAPHHDPCRARPELYQGLRVANLPAAELRHTLPSSPPPEQTHLRQRVTDHPCHPLHH